MATLDVDDASDLHVFELFLVLLGMYIQVITWGFLCGLKYYQFNETIYLSKNLPLVHFWVDFLYTLDTQHCLDSTLYHHKERHCQG